jgi:hypothetical protein
MMVKSGLREGLHENEAQSEDRLLLGLPSKN